MMCINKDSEMHLRRDTALFTRQKIAERTTHCLLATPELPMY